jgi:hypothetical protein
MRTFLQHATAFLFVFGILFAMAVVGYIQEMP